MAIAVFTDSSSQLSSTELADAGIGVIPIVISIDGTPYLDGVDLTAADFYSRIGHGVELATSQPSPGDFVRAWTGAQAAGATEIVSVHVGDEFSGTLNAARLAAGEVDLPVHLVDSTLTSYGLGVIALEVADLVARTGSSSGVDEHAARVAKAMTTVFILQDLRYIMKGGRMRVENLPDGSRDIPVLGGTGGGYRLLETGRTVDELVEHMGATLLEGEHDRHVAIAFAAPDTLVFTERLEQLVSNSPKVVSTRRYRMGPAVAVHTGPGTAGGFSWPTDLG